MYDFKISDLQDEIGYNTYYTLASTPKFRNLSIQDKMLFQLSNSIHFIVIVMMD